jgi:outer membrane protein
MSLRVRVRKLAIGLLAFAALPVQAEQKPLWEAGIGVGGLMFDDYRGSDESNFYPVPVPYFVYRGRILKADRDGVRGLLFDRRYAEINMSVNATTPVESDDNDARRGMPDLKSTLELGPSFEWHVWRSTDERIKLDLRFPVRVPITIEPSPQTVGWIFSPRVNVDFLDVAGYTGWDLGVSIGPMYAHRKYHEYFYSVSPAYATAQRPAYEADGGYSGSHLIVSLSKRFAGYWVGAFLRYDSLSGAAFESSPLVKTKSSMFGGFGIAWMLGESKRLVESDD